MALGKLTSALVLIVIAVGCNQIVRVKDNWQALRQVSRHDERRHPRSTGDRDVERVAKEIDWLEHRIETFGSIVPKQPDVWGEARLTKHRYEVEKQLHQRLGEFKISLQGSLKRADSSFLAAALALDTASTGKNDNDAKTLLTTSSELLPKGKQTPVKTAEITHTFVSGAKNLKDAGISLEPTIHNEHSIATCNT